MIYGMFYFSRPKTCLHIQQTFYWDSALFFINLCMNSSLSIPPTKEMFSPAVWLLIVCSNTFLTQLCCWNIINYITLLDILWLIYLNFHMYNQNLLSLNKKVKKRDDVPHVFNNLLSDCFSIFIAWYFLFHFDSFFQNTSKKIIML